MPATGYTAWSVVFGEQPTATKWNYLGDNDAAFNTGAGFNDGIIIGRHLDSNIKAGWIDVSGETWTYSSVTGITGVINVPSDATTRYNVGDKIKIVQSATTKYFYITGITATTLSVNGGADYSLANSAISGQMYSKWDTPTGFPSSFNYAPTWTNLTVGNGVQTSKFKMVAKQVQVQIKIVFGSTTSITAGDPAFSLPVTARSGYIPFHPVGLGGASSDITGGGSYDITAAMNSTTSGTLNGITTSGASAVAAQVNATQPFTWGNGNALTLQLPYEAA